MENSFKDEAIVLKKTEVGEIDLSITVFMRKIGKESIYIPKGQLIKNITITASEPFNWFKGVFIKRKEKIFIKEIDDFKNLAIPIAKNLDKFYTGFFILDFFNRYASYEKGEEKLFILLKKSIYYLQKEKNIQNFKVNFLAKLIKLLGIFPQLKKCVSCGKGIDKYSFSVVSIKEGGSLCKKCNYRHKGFLTYRDIVFISILENIPFNKIGSIHIPDREKIEMFLIEYLKEKM